MKKIVFLGMILLIIVAFLITGCNSASSAPTQSGSKTAPIQPAAVTTTTTATAAAQKVINWRMQFNLAKGTPDFERVSKGVHGFCKLVEQGSGGRLIITPFGTGELLPDPQAMDAVGAQTIDVAHMVSAYWGGLIPVSNLAGFLPYVIGGWDAEQYIHQAGGFDIVSQEYAKRKVHLLGLSSMGDSPVFSKKPVNTLDDLKGMKIRALGLAGAALKPFGVSVTTTAVGEIYASLQTGILDGAQCGTTDAGLQMHLADVAPYILMPALSPMVMKEIIVSQADWDALPNDLKTVVDTAAQTDLLDLATFGRYRASVALQTALQNGQIKGLPTLSAQDVAQLKKASMQAISDFVTAKNDPATTKLYQILSDYLKVSGQVPQ
jgi:TRAP-type mannitol/chloroaromatic compound transport system substrate-binding protein